MAFDSRSAPDEAHAPPAAREDLPLYKSLDKMAQHEADLEDPNYDPAKDVGEIDATREGIKRKIDAIEAKLYAFKCDHEKYQRLAKFYAEKASAAKNNGTRLKVYVRDQLLMRDYQMIAGNEFEARVMSNTTPTLKLEREEPTHEDLFALGKRFVTEIPARLEWNEDEIEAALVAAHRNPSAPRPNIEGASIEFGKHIRFFPAKAAIARKPKGKKA